MLNSGVNGGRVYKNKCIPRDANRGIWTTGGECKLELACFLSNLDKAAVMPLSLRPCNFFRSGVM